MLTKKELDYVNWPIDKVPFPGQNYAIEVAEKLNAAFELYKKSYQDREYDIITSDGRNLTFEILRKNISHMLGVNYKNVCQLLEGNPFGEHGGSFDVLVYLIDRLDDIIKHDAENTNRFLNYFRVMIKSTIFMSFSDFSSFDFGMITFNKDNYNEEKYGRYGSNSTTLLFTPSNETITPYYFMGLMYDQTVSQNVVETLYAPVEMARFIDNQELVIPTQILITDKSSMELTKLEATSKEKIEILRMYQNLFAKERIQAFINIMGDYESMLIDDSNNLTRKK